MLRQDDQNSFLTFAFSRFVRKKSFGKFVSAKDVEERRKKPNKHRSQSH